MAATFTLAGRKVTSARVHLPAWGAWFAEVSVDGEVALTGQVDLVLSDLTLKGTILSGGAAKGRSDFRLVGGKGRWGKSLKKKSYANDLGVKASNVLVDAATEAGETLDASTLPADRVGPAFARPSGPACRVLEQLALSNWYVGEDGITRIGRRATKTYSGTAARVTPIDKARATVTLAAETIAALVPGAVVDGLEAVDVLHTVSAKGGLRTTVYGKRGAGGTTSRALEAFRAILDQLDPDRMFRGVYEYRVVTLAGSRLNLQPVLVSTGMPDLQRVPVRPGVAGAKSTLVPGARVLVAFVNADPTRPEVLGMEDADGEGFKPLLTAIDAQTLVQLGAGVKPVIAAGDLAGGIWPCIPTQTKVLV